MSHPPVTKRRLSSAIAELMPGILRGVRLDFFVQKGVTQTQFVVLAAILAGRRSTMGALAKSLHVRMPTMTGIVDRLEARGLLERKQISKDRRVKQLVLTPEGRRLRRRVDSLLSTTPGLSALAPPQQEVLRDLLKRTLERSRGKSAQA